MPSRESSVTSTVETAGIEPHGEAVFRELHPNEFSVVRKGIAMRKLAFIAVVFLLACRDDKAASYDGVAVLCDAAYKSLDRLIKNLEDEIARKSEDKVALCHALIGIGERARDAAYMLSDVEIALQQHGVKFGSTQKVSGFLRDEGLKRLDIAKPRMGCDELDVSSAKESGAQMKEVLVDMRELLTIKGCEP